MYTPNKPVKYGIKIIMVWDSSTKYTIDASIHLGKETKTGGLPSTAYDVKDLTKTVHDSKRNIPTNNWFTSVNLAQKLLKAPYNRTLVGTLEKNKK